MSNITIFTAPFLVLTLYTTNAVCQPGMPTTKGGSNFNTYGQARCFSPPPSYEQWNPISNFDIDSSSIISTLQTMRSTLDPTNGNALSVQESIRLNVFHVRNGERCQSGLGTRGINLDSVGGGLSPVCFWNLRQLVSSLASNGYKQILIGLHPQALNNPYNWPADWADTQKYGQYYMSSLSENWNFINEVRCAVREGLGLPCAGTSMHPTIAYRIDLFNEGSFYQHPSYGVLLYTHYIWINYFSSWGKADTVGFSVAAKGSQQELESIVDAMEYIYTVNGVLQLPHVLEYHVETYTKYTMFAIELQKKGYNMPWIVGETAYYNDAVVADQLAQAQSHVRNSISPTHSVLFLVQWPVLRGDSSCAGGEGKMQSPDYFSRYNAKGW